jgi:hypothetical protein
MPSAQAVGVKAMGNGPSAQSRESVGYRVQAVVVVVVVGARLGPVAGLSPSRGWVLKSSQNVVTPVAIC